MAKQADDDYQDDEFSEEPELKPKVTVLTLILLVLNVIAAGAFVYCLFLDMEKRQAWSYAVFLHDLAIMGLPLEEEEQVPTASRETRPRQNLQSSQLQAAYQARKVGSIREPFQAVDEQLPARILPSHFNEDNLKDIFGDLPGNKVKTLEEEIKRVQESYWQDFTKAAQDFAAAEKTDEDKRQKLAQIWLPQATNIYQVRALDKKIKEAKAADLDNLLIEAAKRRMVLDFLQPLEMVRPGQIPEVKEPEKEAKDKETREKTEQLEDLDSLKSKVDLRLKNATEANFDSKIYHGSDWQGKERDTIEKRQNIAYLLFALAHVNKPDGTPLYPRGPERAQVVVGLYEFAIAAQIYTEALQTLEKRAVQLIRNDREGAEFEVNNKVERTPGFVNRYPVVIHQLRVLVGDIDQAEKRLKEIQNLKQQAEKNYEDRLELLKETTAKIQVEREKTAKLIEQLRLVQASLFRAQVELADAAEINFRLEIQLRELENKVRKLATVGGGQAP